MNNLTAFLAASPKEQGQRILELRRRYGLTREAFVQHGIPIATLQNWEKVRYASGLNRKGANRLVNAYASLGVTVTTEWLLYGAGPSPYLNESPEISHGTSLSKEAKITQELRLFHQLNENVVDLIVPDHAMAPAFLPGDCVAGERFFDKEIEKAVGHPCIIHTSNGQILFRLLEKGDKENLYTLTGFNPKALVILNISLFSAAPILWMRRKLDKEGAITDF